MLARMLARKKRREN